MPVYATATGRMLDTVQFSGPAGRTRRRLSDQPNVTFRGRMMTAETLLLLLLLVREIVSRPPEFSSDRRRANPL